ncbi:hypothetical protein AMATHDRAFT_74778 [Amanita thiersii Skay4041]|uniref:SAC domain-containing protein n=1 Tax=Amanita thiersii Skay4041 TaxID=703135 RepID=A0A2A9NNR2_9AGAR|nr:hypothetical protein AMATHDRAFT_74778 [Amanita thiersii Skay4041]
MKRLFAKASKSFAGANNSSSGGGSGASRNRGQDAPAVTNTPGSNTNNHRGRQQQHLVITHATGLQPKYVLPAVPQPYPHDYLVVVCTKEGLLIKPQIDDESIAGMATVSIVRLRWGKGTVVVEEVVMPRGDVDWKKNGVVIYGIVGVLELFSCSYLLVIASRTSVGHLLDPSHTVYCVKNVVAIPLVEERARTVLYRLAAQNAAGPRPSLIPRALTMDIRTGFIEPSIEDILFDSSPSAPTPQSATGANTDAVVDAAVGPKVHFAPQSSAALMPEEGTHPLSSSPHSSLSDLSTILGTEHPSSPVIKAIAPRLSFWSRLTKPRKPLLPAASPETASATGSVKEKWKEGNRSGLGSELEVMEAQILGGGTSTNVGQEVLERLIHEKREEPSEVLGDLMAAFALQPPTDEEKHSELETKIVRECIKEYTKGGMYFAYTFDITRSLQQKQERTLKSQREHALLADLDALPSPEARKQDGKVSATDEPYPTLPLWRRVDRQFWWNEWMVKPFVDAGLHSYVLPIMQGYYQTATFYVPSDPPTVLISAAPAPAGRMTSPEQLRESAKQEAQTAAAANSLVDYMIVSRRSRDRAGLRYQRRGVDDEAHVANFVETETIMRVEGYLFTFLLSARERKTCSAIFKYAARVIPLFWTQQGYGLKPPPVLATDRTRDQNLDALKRHFQRTVLRYGPHTIVNLAEQHGREGVITKEYRDFVRDVASKDVTYHEYDFHEETKGMKYENISRLVRVMERTYLWISDGIVFSQQKGVFRVNCIDCLDRTNVVQSAFARYMLNKQLSAIALLLPTTFEKRGTEIDAVFNNVWANNGDAISRAYAGTSALKGDFTRTGKRDLGGMLNDGMNSLARMYSSTFSDWFCQAVIDFMLGNRTITVFSEFLLKLQSTDPSEMVRLSKIRAEAIATSVSRVLPEGERLLSGWTLFAPEDLNTKVGMKFEEKVLLLSAKALYIISYDYTLEKIKLYTRVPLGDIISISKGAYILSPLEETSRDPEENAGFVVTWLTSRQESRMTSYCLRNSVDDIERSMSTLRNGDRTFAAFKVLPVDPAWIRRSSSTGDGGYAEASDELASASTCREAVELIVGSIDQACREVGWSGGILKEDVVSLGEAERMTSVYAKMEYGVKRLLWLGG